LWSWNTWSLRSRHVDAIRALASNGPEPIEARYLERVVEVYERLAERSFIVAPKKN
jgi:hypothetical protein